jgi:hypothetical protein
VRSVVTAEGWKLNCSASGECELYDLRADPHETSNLAGRGEAAAIVEDLTARIRRWQERTGDAVELPGT